MRRCKQQQGECVSTGWYRWVESEYADGHHILYIMEANRTKVGPNTTARSSACAPRA